MLKSSVALIGNTRKTVVDPMVGVTCMLAGQFTTGGVVSMKIRNTLQLLEYTFVMESYRRHDTQYTGVLVLSDDPDVILHSAAAPHVPVPVGGVNVTVTDSRPAAATLKSPGQVLELKVGDDTT